MLREVRAQHQGDDHLPQFDILLPLEPREDVAVWSVEQREPCGAVVVLEHGLVVVAEGEVVGGGHEEGVVAARVVHVMDGGGDYGGQQLEWLEVVPLEELEV